MISFSQKIKTSLFPREARRNVVKFLDEDTDVRQRVSLEVARLDLILVRKTLGRSADVSDEEVVAHLTQNFDRLRKGIDKGMESAAERCIPGFHWLYVLKHLSVLVGLVLPAMSALAWDLVERPEALRVFAFFALVALVAGTVYAMARESMRKNP